MRKNLYLVASFILMSSLSFAGGDVHYSKNKAEKTFYKPGRTLDSDYQAELRNHYAWQNFLSHHGDWWVQFNEENRKPHRAFGTPISVSGADASSRAMNFILNNLNGFNIPASELVLAGMPSTEKHDFVNYYQVHNGLRVLESRMTVKMTKQGQVILFGADVYNDINVDVNPTIVASGAISAATSDITNETIINSTVNSNLFILPVPENKSTKFHLVYEVNVETDVNGIPAKYYTLVDAHSGEVLYRANTVKHFDADHGDPKKGGTIEVETSADVYTTHSYNAATTEFLPNLDFTVASVNYNTDGNGYMQTLASGTQSATFELSGLWSVVRTNNVTPTFTTTVVDGLNSISFNSNANIRERSAYFHVNIVHDHMKAVMPTFTGMDFALPTNVDLTSGDCNAFYNGVSINFYAQANGCTSFATVGDVVYHEYGHGINDNYYQSLSANFVNGAMGEGYADVWAFTITENPILGEGTSLTLPTDFIRRYDQNRKVYPDNIVGEVHADGEIIAGAWWDTYLNLGNDMTTTLDLFVQAYAGLQATTFNGNEGVAFTDVLIDVLQADDTDANIFNGTPNGIEIVDAFDLHGITLISNANLLHSQLTTANFNNPITINSTLQLNFPYTQYLSNVQLAYKVNNGSWNIIPMNNPSGNNYTVDIPAQPIGTVVAYYIFAEDINAQIAAVKPIGAAKTDPNLPYYILVGYDLELTDDGDNFSEFGNFSTGLGSDNNTTGTWILSIPVGSYSTVGDTSTAVQPYYQHTPGGELCYFTQNAPSATDAVGTADVDGGHTTLRSSVFDVSGYTNPTITYYRWYINNPPTGANPGQDWWHVQISNDGGTSWTFVENSKTSDKSWRRKAFRIADYVTPTSTMRLRFIASDSIHIGQNLDGGSLVEAAVDDIQLWDNTINSINENSGSLSISVYPNPATETLNLGIDIMEESTISYEIYDVAGRLVISGSIGKLSYGGYNKTINIQELSSGSYTIKVIADNTSHTTRFVKD